MVIVTRLVRPAPGQKNWTSQVVTPMENMKELIQWDMLVKPKRLIESAWWRWMPGVTFTVKWPVGWVILDQMPDGSTTSAFSADPNSHYRPWMEKNVGRQGWDWQWALHDNNAAENRLTIKIRNKHAKWATMATLQWS